MRSPIRYPGGKGMCTKKLLRLMPPHEVYAEVFGGGASLLFAKDPVKLEIYNDINHGLVSLFRVLRDPIKFQQFYFKVCLTPYSREECYHCQDTWHDEKDELELAWKFYVMCRQSYGADITDRSWSFRRPSNDYTQIITRWFSSIDMLPEIHQRLMPVQVEFLSFIQFFDKYDSENAMFYLDPPYYGINGLYSHEFTEQDHENLIMRLGDGVKAKMMLSNYRNDLYDLLHDCGWYSYDFETVSGTAASAASLTKSAKRIETVYMNYDPREFIKN